MERAVAVTSPRKNRAAVSRHAGETDLDRRACWPGLAIGLAGLLWLAALHGPSARAQTVIAPENILAESVTALSQTDLTALLDAVGIAGEASQTDSGDPVVGVRTDGGGRFFIALRTCPGLPEPACPHLELYAPFAGAGPNGGLEALNLFNRQAVGIKAFRLDDETLVLTRYVTLNHGMAKGNILGNVVGFQRSAERFRTFLAGPPQVPGELGPQVAVTNGPAISDEQGDPAYAPASEPWPSVVNDPGTDQFKPEETP